jgi:hypothetical protein
MKKEICQEPLVSIIEPTKVIKVSENDVDFFDTYGKISKNTIIFWSTFFNQTQKLRDSISEGFKRVEKVYNVDHKEAIIDINIDGYEQTERHLIYKNNSNSFETYKVAFRHPLKDEYLKYSNGQEVGIEIYNYKMKIPSCLNNDHKEVYILPIFNKKGLSGELLRITKTRK